jgi:hypothetical protein
VHCLGESKENRSKVPIKLLAYIERSLVIAETPKQNRNPQKNNDCTEQVQFRINNKKYDCTEHAQIKVIKES